MHLSSDVMGGSIVTYESELWNVFKYTPFLLYRGSYFIAEFAYLLISHLLRLLSVVYISSILGRRTTGSKKKKKKKKKKWTNIQDIGE